MTTPNPAPNPPPGSPFLTTAQVVTALQMAAAECSKKAGRLPSPASNTYNICAEMLTYLAQGLNGTWGP